MRKAEINEKFDEIVGFSGVEAFLDTPVKHYSSGMVVRLAFAVACQLDSDILIIDEVLGVGDAEFRARSMAKIQNAISDGRTVLLVSHDLHSMKSLCTRGILLHHGRLLTDGSVEEVAEEYAAQSLPQVGTIDQPA
jgi:lipopolysaccharide transport system ATP-binding protein